MARRTYKEPVSRLAVFSVRLVLLAGLVAVISVLAARADWLDGLQATSVLAVSLGTGLLAAILGMIAAARIWVTGYGGARYAVAAILIGLAMAAGPAILIGYGLSLPVINDVSTDTEDPPAFDSVAQVRPPNANPIAYPRPFASLQREAYPEVRSLDLDIPADDLNEIVSEIVEQHRFRVLDQVDLALPATEGRYEMVTRSMVMGFRDDIVIRLRPVGGRLRVDIRSASRYGRHDFGVNARRIEVLLDEIRLAARRVQR